MDGCQGSRDRVLLTRLASSSPILLPETPAADKPSLIYFHRETPACIARFRRYLDFESAHPPSAAGKFFPYRNAPPPRAFPPIIEIVSLYRKRPFAGNNKVGTGREPFMLDYNSIVVPTISIGLPGIIFNPS